MRVKRTNPRLSFCNVKPSPISFQVLVRFGTLLEAFCRGLGPYLKKLIKQTEALDKLTKLTDSLKERFEAAPGKERMKFMFESIKKEDYVESLQFFHSPLENTVLLGELDIGQCKSMDSAKKPLWLVWKNPDELADKLHEYNAIIFKNGDDLRQDMLTLQGELLISSYILWICDHESIFQSQLYLLWTISGTWRAWT